MSRLVGPFNSGAASGGAGVATANASTTHLLSGLVMAVYIKYNDSPPATTDIVVKTVGTSPAAPTRTILSLTDAATDGWFQPRVNVHNQNGAAQSLVWDYIPMHDVVNVAIAQANDADNIDVWLMLE
jgi:hypothetical protein